MILYRPVNQAELDLIIATNWKRFPPRLSWQPIFYPVLNEAYAIQITQEWNVPSFGIGHVLRFEVNDDFIRKYKIKNVGGKIHDELWIQAKDLEEMNDNIIGTIEVIHTFKK